MSRRALVARIRAMASTTPGAVAARDEATTLTWGELDRRSDSVAFALRAVEPRAGRCVALLCEHRVEAIVAMLGALKSDLCLVPMNVHESDEWLTRLWRDVDRPVVLADSVHGERARALVGDAGRVLAVDEVALEPVAVADLPPLGTDGADLLAILYTTGTTDEPKGVMTTAASVLERALQSVRASRIAARERQAVITSWHFAASFPEVYGALVAGAQLCLYDAHARGVEGLSEWIRDRRIELLQLPVAMARRLLGQAKPGAFPSVRFVSVSGERLRRDEAETLLAAMTPGATLLHPYGSTETNLIASCALRLPSDDWPESTEAGFLPVGAPAAGKIVRILGPDGRPLAVGEVGCIAVESDLLSPGYWKQPERTRASFTPGSSGRRVYRTGDFGRMRADGVLELTGRDATHVKVRGMRVDLAAVETSLLALASVANAAVVVHEAREGESRIVAYVEAVARHSLDTTGLRHALSGKLPAHAIPSRFVFVEAMPWTPNGKLDRRRLPDPGRTRPKLAEVFVAPRDAEEALVCASWRRLFDLDEIGIHDGFFDLGGDSLRLVEMVFDIERRTGRTIPLAGLGGIPTPARVAALIRSLGEQAAPDAVDDVRPSSRAADAPSTRAAPKPLRRRAFDRLRRELKHPLRAGGPLLLGRPLSYASGIRLQTSLAKRLVHAGVFRRALAPVEAWHERLARDASLEQTLVRSVMSNIWVDWRLRALEAEDAFERWVTLEGQAHLDAVVDQGRGLVLVLTHVHWNALLLRIPGLSKRELVRIHQPKGRRFGDGPDAIVTERAEQLQAAHRVLLRGGLVLIAGDAGHGEAVIERSGHGAVRRFRPGAAALAEATGAALLPVFSRLRDDGGVVFLFEPPVVSVEATAAARILDRTARYADAYIARWPRIFDSQTWKSVRRALEPPDHW